MLPAQPPSSDPRSPYRRAGGSPGAAAGAPRPRRGGPPRRGPSRGQRLIALELSAGLHLAIFLVLLGLPSRSLVEPPKAAKKEPIAIEVAFVQTPSHHAEAQAPHHTEVAAVPQPQQPKAPPAHPKPVPQPPVRHTRQIDTPRQAAPRFAERAPKPVNREVERPRHADPHALLQQRIPKRNPAEESALAQLGQQANEGADHGREATAPRQGAVSNNDFSGDLSTRQILSRAVATYPDYDRQHGIQGSGRYRIVVNSAGTVVNVEVLRTAGSPRLDRAAVNMLYRYRFSPDPTVGNETGESDVTFDLH